jgi:putative ABC transport system ATP-binding protein
MTVSLLCIRMCCWSADQPPTRASEPNHVLLSIQALAKSYGATPVFDAVTLDLAAGEFVALVGESGVGKSSLLNCIAGLDNATQGHVRVTLGNAAPVDVTTLSDDARALLRRRHFGFVFQAFHVLPHLNVAENVGLPLRLLGGLPGGDDDARAMSLLAAVGLQGLHARMPAQLSGGQLQRVAIARALVHRPAVVLADEPTGNLDPDMAELVLDALAAQAREHNTACLLVTHSLAATRRADRVLRLTAHGIQPG